VAAIRAAIDKVGLILLENHTRGCVVDAIQHDRGDVAVDELMEVLHKFLD
jgi:DNA-binding FrmR family transcriptional regulator